LISLSASTGDDMFKVRRFQFTTPGPDMDGCPFLAWDIKSPALAAGYARLGMGVFGDSGHALRRAASARMRQRGRQIHVRAARTAAV